MIVPDPFSLPESGALLGLDPGARRIGVAACDPERSLVTPVTTIHRDKLASDLAALFALYDARGCAGLVIGLPVNMDGTEGPRAQSARAFARNILKTRDIPIHLQDERLSSAAADDLLAAAPLKRGQRRARRDETAAAVILQSALDAIATARRQGLPTGAQAGKSAPDE